MKNLLILPITLLLFSCSKEKELPLLKLSEDNRYIVTEYNKPFFWLGGTAWELIHRLNREEVDQYMDNRASKGFTVVQTVVLAELDGLNTPNAYGHKPLIGNDPTQLNEAYFEHVDYVVKKAAEFRMYIGMLPTWGDKFNKAWGEGPEVFTPENARIFGELLAKRYLRHKNIIWILGGDRWPEDDEDRAIIEGMAAGIRSVDSIHLVTYHPNGGRRATEFFNETWLDFDMFQSGHDRTIKDYQFVWTCREVEPKRPVINGEPRYENHPDRFNAVKYGWMDAADVRASAWWSMLSGAAGYTYGCHDIWQMYSHTRTAINGARTEWSTSLNLPGSTQLHYMKKLLEQFPWQKMNNDQSLILSENLNDSSFVVASIGDEKDFVLAYVPIGNAVKIDLAKITAENVKAYWYNPRDSKSVEIGEYKTTEIPEFKPWSVGWGSDFVLVIMDAKAPYKLPE